jgi:Fe2+ transport system protein FeoA
MGKISLVQMKSDSKAKVVEIIGGSNLQSKLMSMGIYEGKEITKLSHIGLKGPVVVKSGRSILAFGYGVALKIMVDN